MLPLHAQSGPEYREFRLGSSLARVLSQVHLTGADVSPVHERPTLIQDLRWTTPYFITDSSEPKNDSVGQIVFSFVDDQLFRLAIDYEPKRTEGMTDRDMIVALSARYGSLMTAPGPAETSILDRAADETGRRVAQWHDGDIVVVLSRGAFTKALHLVVASAHLDGFARTASAEAVGLEQRDAVSSGFVQRTQDADDARLAKEKVRLTNKATFQP